MTQPTVSKHWRK